jgi:hypothetical protein
MFKRSANYRSLGPLLVALVLVIPAAMLLADQQSGSETATTEATAEETDVDRSADEELACLLVKLEKQTRKVIAGHYGRQQEGGPEATKVYKDYMIKNLILPAAVADPIFSEVVPEATGGRAWVKMVVPEPRNPNNLGDATALEMFEELQEGAAFAERKTSDACYYGEPIVATAGCLQCHGSPAGEPDPNFPQYKKNGWQAGDVVGGVIARVAHEK